MLYKSKLITMSCTNFTALAKKTLASNELFVMQSQIYATFLLKWQ